MAVYDYTRPAQSARPGAASRLWTGLISLVLDWNSARRTRNSLRRLSERELSDLGMVRGDLDRITGRR